MGYVSSRRGEEEYEQADRDTIRLLSQRNGDHRDDGTSFEQERRPDKDSILRLEEAEEAPPRR